MNQKEYSEYEKEGYIKTFYQIWNSIKIGEILSYNIFEDVFKPKKDIRKFLLDMANALYSQGYAESYKEKNKQPVFLKKKDFKIEEYGKITTNKKDEKKEENKRKKSVYTKGECLFHFLQSWNLINNGEKFRGNYVKDLIDNSYVKFHLARYLSYMVKKGCAERTYVDNIPVYVKIKDYTSSTVKNYEKEINKKQNKIPIQEPTNLPSQMTSHDIGENIFLFMINQSETLSDLTNKNENINKLYTDLKKTYDDLFNKYKVLDVDFRNILSKKTKLEELQVKRVEEINKLNKIIYNNTGKVFNFAKEKESLELWE